MSKKAKEKVQAAPKELLRRGLLDGTERLRDDLRGTAQGGQRDGFGGDQIEDAAAAGTQRTARGAVNLLKKERTGRAKDSKGKAPTSDSASHEAAPEVDVESPTPQASTGSTSDNPAPTAPKNTDRPRIKTREYSESVPTESGGASQAWPRQRPTGSASPKVRENCIPIKTREAVEPDRFAHGGVTDTPMQRSTGFSANKERVKSKLQAQANRAPTDVVNNEYLVPESGLPTADQPVSAKPLTRTKAVAQEADPARSANRSSASRRQNGKRPVKPVSQPDRTTARPVQKSSPAAGPVVPKTRSETRAVGRKAQTDIKTANRTVGRTVKTADRAAKGAAQKAAVHAPQRAVQAAQATARGAAQAAVAAPKTAAKAARSAVKMAMAAAKSLTALMAAGGWVVALLILVICLAGQIANSPFGIFFSGGSTPETISPSAAVTQLNGELADKLSELEAGGTYDRVETQGGPPPWAEVFAVFSVRTAAGETDAQPVAVLDAGTVDRLRTVFWDMTKVTSSEETVDHPASGSTPAWTETVLTITVTPRTPDDMRTFYSFTDEQNAMLDELLAPESLSMWSDLLYGASDGIVAVALSQVGNIGGQPYWSWYGFSRRVEWCACFVSWCANECGYIDAGIMPKFSGCGYGASWFKTQGLWQESDYVPSPGDIIFFDWARGDSRTQDGSPDHVGIVERVENGIIYTVEGNSSNGCRQRSYSVGHFEIFGFGTPSYTNGGVSP